MRISSHNWPVLGLVAVLCLMRCDEVRGADRPPADKAGTEFFEKNVRPILVKHCYECHSESAGEQQGGLLLDRSSGWLKGGNTQKAVVPGEVAASLLVTAISYKDKSLQMPPEKQLGDREIAVLTNWIRIGAPGPAKDVGDSEFSRLGDQNWLFEQAAGHWAFQPIPRLDANQPPDVADTLWNKNPIDRFVYSQLASKGLSPSPQADPRTFLRRDSSADLERERHHLRAYAPGRERDD